MSTLRRIAAMGFEGVELSSRWLNLFEMGRQELADLKHEVREAGIAVSGINMDRCLLVRAQNAKSNLDRLSAAIDIAAALGAPLVNFALSAEMQGVTSRPVFRGAHFTSEEFQYSLQQIRALARHARSSLIEFSIELHDDGMLDTPESCARFVDAVGEPNVGVNPDVGNMCRNRDQPGDWHDAILSLSTRANCWHVKNYRNALPASLSDGDVDFQCAFEIMARNGFNGWVSNESRTGDTWETQKLDLAYMKSLLDRTP